MLLTSTCWQQIQVQSLHMPKQIYNSTPNSTFLCSISKKTKETKAIESSDCAKSTKPKSSKKLDFHCHFSFPRQPKRKKCQCKNTNSERDRVGSESKRKNLHHGIGGGRVRRGKWWLGERTRRGWWAGQGSSSRSASDPWGASSLWTSPWF